MIIRALTLAIGLVIFPFLAKAQIIGGKSDSGGKRWNVRFVVDGSPFPALMHLKDEYHGEYFTRYSDPDTSYESWSWVDRDSSSRLSLRDNYFFHLRLGMQVNVFKNLYLGVNYSGYILQRFNQENPDFTFIEYIPLVTLSASLSYAFPISKRLELVPMFATGNYQSDPYYGFEGEGREWSWEGRLGMNIRLRGNFLRYIRVWTAYNHLSYKAVQPSWVYPDRVRETYTAWQLLNFGIGVVWHLQIDED